MPPIIKIVRSYWSIFLLAWLVPATLAAIVILNLPKRTEIRSALALATTYDQGRDKVIDSPDQVAKAAIEVYLPAALFGSGAKKENMAEVPRRLRADVYGSVISLSDRATIGAEGHHIDLQQRILDEIVAQQRTLTDRARELLDLNIKSAQRTISNLEDQEKISQNRLRHLDKQSETQGETISNLRRSLDVQPNNQPPGEDVQYIRDRLWSEEDAARETDITRARITRDLADISRQKEEQTKSIAFNNLQLAAIKDAHVILPPVAAPLANARKLLFLMAALIGSLFFAVLVILTLDRIRYRSHA